MFRSLGTLVKPRNLVGSVHCLFHKSTSRTISPLFWLLLKPVIKIGTALSGRQVRKWWKALPSEKKSTIWTRMKQNWPIFPVLGVGVCVTGVSYYSSHVLPAPVTGRDRFMIITNEQMFVIAVEESKTLIEEYKDILVPVSNPIFQHILEISTKLLAANPELRNMKVKKWQLSLINDEQINACVLPNGHIFVHMGLVKFTQNEDQLAMIIGHEMSHALLSHGAEMLSFAQLMDFAVIAIMAAIWTVMPNDGIALVTQWFNNKVINLIMHMPYSRKLEKEADKVGLQLAAQACYDVREGSVLWKRMMLRSSIVDGKDPIPEWLSTHPAHAKRSEHLNFLIPEAIKMRSICGCLPLPSVDPRDHAQLLESAIEERKRAKMARQNLQQSKIPLVTHIIGQSS